MPLTDAQKTTLKNHINANTTEIVVGGVTYQIKDVPNSLDTAQDVANWYNGLTANYWVWNASVLLADIYFKISPANTVFDFDTYKAQNVTEQNAWIQMFMGGSGRFALLNFREGVFAIFKGSTAQNNQRAHIFASGRRLARRIEELYAQAPQNGGNITVDADNGNIIANAAGDPTNPYVAIFDGTVTAGDVHGARNFNG
jgi:hypothetical protein